MNTDCLTASDRIAGFIAISIPPKRLVQRPDAWVRQYTCLFLYPHDARFLYFQIYILTRVSYDVPAKSV
jgi:hypothetical protein